MNRLILLFLFCLFAFTANVRAQVPSCGANVPFQKVDLRGKPNGAFLSATHSRLGQCCGVTGSDVCTSFEILLDTAAVALNFEVASGAVPGGAMYYQIECGPQVAVGQPICLKGVGPHRVTFCKPGNNTNTYRITSISYPLFPKDDTVRVGCSKTYNVQAIEPSSVSWTSVSPGTPGQYNKYLSCTNCVSPKFTPDANTPVKVKYKICGFPIADECGYNIPTCDTVELTTVGILAGSATPNPASFCNTGAGKGVTLSASGSGGVLPYTYIWKSSAGTNTGNSFFENKAETVTLEIRDKIYDVAECPAYVLNVPVSESPLPIVNAGQTQTLCATAPAANLSGSVQNATGVIWSGGGGGFNPGPTSLNPTYTPTTSEIKAKSITLTLSSSGAGTGCPVINSTVKLTFRDTLKAPVTFSRCFTNSTDSSVATVAPSGGDGGPYRISYDNGTTYGVAGIYTAKLAQGKSYTILVKDNSGCFSIPSTVIIPAFLSVTGVPSLYSGGFNIACNGSKNGAVDISVSGGKIPYTYSWNTGSANEDISSLDAGTYTITVKDGNNCSSVKGFTLIQPAALNIFLTPSIYTGGVNINCFGNSTGSVTTQATGGDQLTYQFAWTGPSGFNSTNKSISDLRAGTYTVSLIDANNCKLNKSITLSQPAQLNLSTVPVVHSGGFNISCNGFADGAITTAATGGITNYLYKWTGPGGYTNDNKNISGLAPGVYSLTVSDANSCKAFSQESIIEPSVLSFSTTAKKYSGGFNISCSGLADGAITVSPSGGDSTTYKWNYSGPAGYSSTTQNPVGLIAGNYMISLTDKNGCSETKSITLFQPQPMVTDLTAAAYSGGFNVSCQGKSNGSITSVTEGGDTSTYIYTWSGAGNFSSSDADVDSLKAGSYSLLVTDANNCSTAKTIILKEPENISLTATPASYSGGFNTSCNGKNDGAIQTVVTGGDLTSLKYNWSGPDGFTSDKSTLTGLKAGTYILTVSDSNGCGATATTVLTEPEILTVSVKPATLSGDFNISCNGASDGKIALQATGGDLSTYSFKWTGPNGFTSSKSGLNGLQAGVYTYTVTDKNGCSETGSLELKQPDSLKLDAIAIARSGGYNISCNNTRDGNIKLNLTGGDSSSYQFLWTGPNGFASDSDSVTFAEAGTYAVTVTDNNGCSAKDSVTLLQPDTLVASISSDAFSGNSNISCFGNADGKIKLTVDGGDSLTYKTVWTGPNGYTASGTSLNGLKAGTYTVTVTDANKCTTSDSVTLTEPAKLTVVLAAPEVFGGFNISCNGTNDGSVNAAITGADPSTYKYLWTGPGGFTSDKATIDSIGAGPYTLIVTDVNGCADTSTIAITQPDSLKLTGFSPVVSGGYNITCNGKSDGSIVMSSSGGDSLTYRYIWTGPNGFTADTRSVSGLNVGTYSVTLTDSNGCSDSEQIIITQPDSLKASFSAKSYSGNYNLSCNGNADGSLNLGLSGGDSTTYKINWTGPDGFVSTETNPDSLKAGVYHLTLTDKNGCSFIDSVELTQPDPFNIALASPVFSGGFNIRCNGAREGSIDGTVSGADSSTYKYKWSGPAGFTSDKATIDSIGAGSYTLIVTDANGCADTSTIAITQPDSLKLTGFSPVVSGGYNITCNGKSDGSIVMSSSGGDSLTYKYLWIGPDGFTADTRSVSGLKPGAYTVTLTDSNGCFDSEQIIITQPDTLKASFSAKSYSGNYNLSCNGEADGSLNLGLSGGDSTTYKINWAGPDGFVSTETNPDSLKAGVYHLTLTDKNGCSFRDSVELTQPDPFNIALASPVFSGGFNIRCNGAREGSIDGTVSGADSSTYKYKWSGPAGFTSDKATIDSIGAGSYTLIVTDLNGCADTSTIAITQPDSLKLTGFSPVVSGGYNITCNGKNDGSIIMSSAGGDSLTYKYLWTGPDGFTADTRSVSGLNAGTYNVSLTDSNGCSDSEQIIITQPDTLKASFSAKSYSGNYNLSCNGEADGSLNLGLSGGDSTTYKINWTGPDGFVSTETNPDSLKAGVYYLTLTDKNGCSFGDSVELTQPDPFNIALASPVVSGGYNIRCNGANDGSINATVSGADSSSYVYNWIGPAGFSSSQSDVNNLAAGQYTLVVSDNNGCSDTTSIVITEPDTLSPGLVAATVNGGYNISCDGMTDGAINLNTTGGDTTTYSFRWTGPDGYVANTRSISNLRAGQYVVTVKDSNGCVSSDTVTLKQPGQLNSTIEASAYNGNTNISCNGSADGHLVLTPAGGDSASYSYSWTGPDGFTSSEKSLQGLKAGQYMVTIKDANNCSFTDTFALAEPNGFSIQLTSPEVSGGFNISCSGKKDGSINVAIAGGDSTSYSYIWSGPAGFTSTTRNLTNIGAGSYILSVKDSNNCTASDTLVITAPDSLKTDYTKSSFNGTDISCYGRADGSLEALISGGDSTTYSYSWSGPDGYANTGKKISDLKAGEYILTVSDANGCSYTDTTSIIQPDSLKADAKVTTAFNGYSVSCAGSLNGTASVTATGGNAPYIYSWSNAVTMAVNSGIGAGKYSVKVSDKNNCTASDSINLNEPTPIISSAQAFAVRCNGFSDGGIDLTVAGGLPAYTFRWSNGAVTEDLSNITTGSYKVIITDLNNCQDTITTFVGEKEPLKLTATATDETCPQKDDGIVTASAEGGVAPYTYTWSTLDVADTMKNLSSGSYLVTAKDMNNCTADTIVTVRQPDTLKTVMTSPVLSNGHNVSFNGGSDGSIKTVTTGGRGSYTYLWSNGSTTETVTQMKADTYNVTVTDGNKCTYTTSIVLSQPDVPELPTGISPNGDNKNDFYVVRGIEAYPVNNLLVVNRWGNTVFEADNYTNNWNGVNKHGGELPDGTYYVVVNLNNGEKILKGFVEIRK